MSLIYTHPTPSATGIRNSIYLGGKSDAKSWSKLQAWGITHSGVANYFESGSKSTNRQRLIYRRIPVFDNSTTNLLPYAGNIVSFISNALHHGSVLVHCQKGISRSSTAVLFYLMKMGGMSLKEGLALCRRRRVGVMPIPAFMEQLRTYEKVECDGGGNSNRTSSDKKRKIGAVGCSIGPSRGPLLPSNDDSATDKATADDADAGKVSIGPSLPPHITRGADKGVTSPAQEEIMDVSSKKVKRAIEPHAKPSKTDDNKSNDEDAVIGPSLPPTSKSNT